MAKGAMCGIAGCEYQSHAKGYCRKHYGQIYRKGAIYVAEVIEKPPPKNDSDRGRALARELRRAQMMYQNVIGVEGRLRWRRELDEVKKEMGRLGITPPVPPPVNSLADIA